MPRTTRVLAPPDPAATPDVRLVRLDTLRCDPDNVRVHPEQNLRAIRESLTAFGQQRPLVVMPDGLVLAGNGTLEAARQLGWQHLAVQVCTLPLDQARAYAVADNRTGELSSWNETGLATLLRNLQAQELPLPGWDEAELKALCAGPTPEIQEGDIHPDRGAELREQYGVEPGQLWQCGDHRVYCGDATDPGSYRRLLGSTQPVLCLTDPPYGVGEQYGAAGPDTPEALEQLLRTSLPLLRDAAPVTLITTGNKHMGVYPIPSWILAWVCPAGVGVGPWGFVCWHPVLAYGSDPYLASGNGSRPDALVLQESTDVSVPHPCVKPLKVWTWLVERGSTHPGDSIIDPFLGGGTSLIAAHQLQRVCYGMDIDPAYVAIALERFSRLTNQTPTLVEP